MSMPSWNRISAVVGRLRSSLSVRLLLAVLSGLPMGYLISRTGQVFYVEGVMLGVFVLAPAIRTGSFLWLRRLAAVGLGTMGTFVLLGLYLSLDGLREIGVDGFETIVSGFVATLVTLLVLAPLASSRLTPRYVVIAVAASLCAGLTFYVFVSELWRWLCFEPCPWWNDLAFAAGWVIWHAEICLAGYFGGGAVGVGCSRH